MNPDAPSAPPPRDHDPPSGIEGNAAAGLFDLGLDEGQRSTYRERWVAPSAADVAALLPHYEITALLGQGGMGAVYEGRQSALGRRIALKLLPAELATMPGFAERFRRESRTLASLQHPGIVAVYESGQTSAGHLYFVMEYVDGTDLQHILRAGGVNPEQALALIVQICEALHYAHGCGVTHRDIKPANVLLTHDGRVKLADFGLARPPRGDATQITETNVIMGTRIAGARSESGSRIGGQPLHRGEGH
jgi:serine/threonine protein kinase